jgi:hypothetical protein
LQAADEASGIPDGVFRPFEGAQTGRANLTILIGDPTRGAGYFFDCSHESSAFWANLHLDVEQSNLDAITKGATDLAGSVSRYAAKYGRNSNAFRTPGVDVAYLVKDRSVICLRHGPVVQEFRVFQRVFTMEKMAYSPRGGSPRPLRLPIDISRYNYINT